MARRAVCAAACMQDRCSVALGESSKMSAQELAQENATGEESKPVKRGKVDKYAHVQSKFQSRRAEIESASSFRSSYQTCTLVNASLPGSAKRMCALEKTNTKTLSEFVDPHADQ